MKLVQYFDGHIVINLFGLLIRVKHSFKYKCPEVVECGINTGTPHLLPSLSPQETSLPLNGCCGREQSIKESLYPSLKGRGNCNKLRRIMSGLEFDPGFAPYILAFRGTVEYLYMDINRFKNLSQKKMKFRQYYKKMLDMFNNNLGFYVGCLMWAAYIKTQPEQEILNNNCLGQEYNEEENVSDTEFMIKFLELLPKDVKYFLGQNYEINQSDMKILELYKEFFILNKGFVNSKNNTDIVLPNGVKTEGAEGFKDKIMEVIKSEDLSKLLEYKDLICQI